MKPSCDIIELSSSSTNMSDSPSQTNNKVLPLPVLIPQRRPGSKSRGFTLAYAPRLEQCGINEQEFLEFLVDVNISLKGNQYLNAIEITAIGMPIQIRQGNLVQPS